MFASDQYELIDFGQGRKLERFGPYLLDRPCPAASGLPCQEASLWRAAHARYERLPGASTSQGRGHWSCAKRLPDSWMIHHGRICLELKLAPFGHVGVFPEQAQNWDWLAAQVRRAPRPPKVLNLFAYTGGSTLAAADAGAEVVHIDAARNVVAWARRNAERSGLADRPIRWIPEDAVKFVRREVRRGKRYDAVILDPPSYGHGPKGEVWKIERHLQPLLGLCAKLVRGRPAFMLLTCHTSRLQPAALETCFADAVFRCRRSDIRSHRLVLRSSAGGRELPSGVVVRWPS